MRKILLVLTLILITQLSFGQMVTATSYLENSEGEKIEYAAFVEKMNTGKYTMIVLKDKSGEKIGFKLKPIEESPKIKLDYNVAEKDIGLNEIIGLDIIYHKHILVPVRFNPEKGGYKEAWLIFDTGTFIPLIIADSVFKKALGKINSIEVNGFKINNPAFGSYSFPEVIKQYNNAYTSEIPQKLNGKPIVGLMGYNLFKNFLVSIDISNEKIYLKNINNEKRTLGQNSLLLSVKYRNDMDNIWIPVTINKQEGIAHLDTGYPYTWVEETMIDKEDISSFKIEGYETTTSNGIDFKKVQQAQNYSNMPFSLIANIGNNFLKPYIITIDSKNEIIYFEKSHHKIKNE